MPYETDDTTTVTPESGMDAFFLRKYGTPSPQPKTPPPAPSPATDPGAGMDAFFLKKYGPATPKQPSSGGDYLTSIAKGNPATADLLSHFQVQPSHAAPVVTTKGGYQPSAQKFEDQPDLIQALKDQADVNSPDPATAMMAKSRIANRTGVTQVFTDTEKAQQEAVKQNQNQELAKSDWLGKLASGSEFVKTAVETGLKGTNLLNIWSSGLGGISKDMPEQYQHMLDLYAPQSETGKAIAENVGGAAKFITEVKMLGKASPALEENPAALFPAVDVAEGVLPVTQALVGGDPKEAGRRALQTLERIPASSVMGDIMGPVSEAAESNVNAVVGTVAPNAPEVVNRVAQVAAKGTAYAGIGEGAAEYDAARTGQPLTDKDRTSAAIGMGAFGALEGLHGKAEPSDYKSNLARLTESVMNDESSKSYTRSPKVGDLISAIGKSEGWGVERGDDGSLQMAKYNSKTTAPFGLLGDTKNNPELANDPQKAYDFMVRKLTNPKSATYVPGLIGEDGSVNMSKLAVLRNKWAPIGAGNDPNNKNSNWLGNVQENLGGVQSPEDFKTDPVSAQAQIKEYFDKNLERTGGDVRKAVYLTGLDLHKKAYSARSITKGFDNATGTGYGEEDVQAAAQQPQDTQTQASTPQTPEAATVEPDQSKDITANYDQTINAINEPSEPVAPEPLEAAKASMGDAQVIAGPDGEPRTVPTATSSAGEQEPIQVKPYEPSPLLDPSTRDNEKLASEVEPQTPEEAVMKYFINPTDEMRFTGSGKTKIYNAFTPESFYKEFHESYTTEASDARKLGLIRTAEKGGKSLDAMAQEVAETYPEAFGDHDSEADRGAKASSSSGASEVRAKDTIMAMVSDHIGSSHKAMREAMTSDLAESHPSIMEARAEEGYQRTGTEMMNERAFFGEEPAPRDEQHVSGDTSLIDIPDATPDHLAPIVDSYRNDISGQLDHERLRSDLSLANENSTGNLKDIYANKDAIQRLITGRAEEALPAVYDAHSTRQGTAGEESGVSGYDAGAKEEALPREDSRSPGGTQSQSAEVTPEPKPTLFEAAKEKSSGVSWGDQRIASAKAKWNALDKEQSGTLGVSIFADPRRIALAAEFMAGHVANGVHAIGDFAKKALEEFGEAVLPHISELYSRTKEHLTSEGRSDLADKMTGKPPPVTPEGQLFEANEPADSFGIRHEDINARRAEAGQPILEKAELTQDDVAHQQAVQELHDKPTAGRELIDRLEESVGKKNESAVVGMEKKLLSLETQSRWERFKQARHEVNNAKPEDLEKTQKAFDLASKDYMQAEDILSRTGSLAGKALQEQKVSNSEDFSLEHMTAVKTDAVNHGVPFKERQPLTIEQANEVQDFYDRDVAAGKAVEEHQNKVHDAQGLEYFNKLFKDFVSDAKEARSSKKKYVDFATEQADKARARIKARQSTLHAEVLPVADLADYAIIGGEYIAKGISALAEWSRSMITEFGEKIRPHLDQIFDASKTRDEANLVATGGKVKAEKSSSDVLGKIDPKKKLSGSDVFDLARSLKAENGIGGGKEGYDQLMKVTHEALSRVIPGITERKVRDTFTHYGEVTVPSQETDLKELRESRSIGLLISKIEDVNSGKAFERTGGKRDAPTPDVREQMKNLQQSLRDHPELKVTDAQMQGKTSLDVAKTRVTNQITDLDRQIETVKAGGDRDPSRAKMTPDDELKQLMAERDAKKATLNELDGKLEQRTNAQKLATYKKVVAANNARLEAKIAAGDYSKPQKNVTVMDTEALRLQATQAANRQAFMAGAEKDRLKNRTGLEKVVDGLMKGRVLSAISSPLIYLKLGSAVALKTVTEPMKEIFGGVISKIIPELANRAPIEGGFSLASEKAALKAEFTVGITAAWNKAIHMKDSGINILYGKSKDKYGTPTQLDRIFYAHDALKEPLVQAVFARSWTKQMLKFQDENGRAPNEFELTEIGKRSMQNALRAKFQQDNFVSRAHANILHILMRDKTNPVAGKILNLVDKALLPVVKTPTNIFGEVNEHLTGLISGSIRAIAAYRAGIENLTPENADLIMRKLKNGTLGAVILAVGYSQRNKDELTGLLGHAPAAALYDLGNDIGKRLDGINRNEEGLGSASLQEMMTLTQTLPYADMITRIAPALRPGKGLAAAFENYTGEMSKSLLVPGVVQDIAKMGDQKDGTGVIGTILKDNTQQRAPEDWLDHVKTGIPGWREQVPKKTERTSRTSRGTRRQRR